jgi:hypothetical protein
VVLYTGPGARNEMFIGETQILVIIWGRAPGQVFNVNRSVAAGEREMERRRVVTAQAVMITELKRSAVEAKGWCARVPGATAGRRNTAPVVLPLEE